MDLMQMLARGQAAQRARRTKPKTLPEARIAHLKEVLERDSAKPFERGDVVTPTKDSGINDIYIGEPHIVLDVYQDRKTGRSLYRIAAIDVDGDVQTVDVGRWHIELYDASAVKVVTAEDLEDESGELKYLMTLDPHSGELVLSGPYASADEASDVGAKWQRGSGDSPMWNTLARPVDGYGARYELVDPVTFRAANGI